MVRFLVALCVLVLTVLFGFVLVDFSNGGDTAQHPFLAWVGLFGLKYYQAYHVWTEVK